MAMKATALVLLCLAAVVASRWIYVEDDFPAWLVKRELSFSSGTVERNGACTEDSDCRKPLHCYHYTRDEYRCQYSRGN